mgnify:CR=1 FL=1
MIYNPDGNRDSLSDLQRKAQERLADKQKKKHLATCAKNRSKRKKKC